MMPCSAATGAVESAEAGGRRVAGATVTVGSANAKGCRGARANRPKARELLEWPKLKAAE